MSNRFLDQLYSRQQRAASSLKDSVSNVDMQGPMCCFCIPLKTGIILICLYGLVDIAQSLYQTQQLRAVSLLVFGFFVAALVPQAIAIFIYLKYLVQQDSFRNREYLMLSCGLLMAANAIEYLGIMAGAIFSSAVEFQAILVYLPINGLNILLYGYFYQICSIWASMFNSKIIISGPGPSGRGGASLGTDNNRENLPAGVSSDFKNPKKKAKTLAELAQE